MSQAIQYLQTRLDKATKVGDFVKQRQLVEMITTWEQIEIEAERTRKTE